MSKKKVVTSEDIAKMSDAELKQFLALMDAAQSKPMPYKAHPKQEVVHRATTQYTLAIAGNRGGKSTVGARELTWRLLGTHPYKTCHVPIKAWVAAPDFGGIAKVLIPKIKGFLEARHIVKETKNSEGVINHMEFLNGSTIDFKTYTQDSMSWESDDIDYFWGDEPPKREHFIAVTARLVDRNGQGLITATPLREPWIFEELWEPGINGHPDITCVNWSSYDNPYVSHEALKRLEARLSPEERRVRIYGEFKDLIGKVFKHFRDDEPFVIPSYKWPDGWPYFEGIDPHISKPHGFVRVGITPEETLVVFNAARPAGGMRELARHILSTRPSHDPIDVIADNSIAVFDQNMGATMQQRLAEFGVPTTLAYKRDVLVPGLEEIGEMFYRTKCGESRGLVVMNDSIEFINEAKRLMWSSKKEEVPVGDDDVIDPVRYIIVMNPWEMADRNRGSVLKTNNKVTYNLDHGQKKVDPRIYGSKAFDLDLDDDDEDDQPPRIVVRY